MLSVREYADKQGVTIQAIYQSLKSKENAERLKGHIFMENGRKMLDETPCLSAYSRTDNINFHP